MLLIVLACWLVVLFHLSLNLTCKSCLTKVTQSHVPGMRTQNVIRLKSNPVDKETSFDEICEDICFDKIYFCD